MTKMKKRNSFGKRIMAVMLSAGIVITSIPASGRMTATAATLPTIVYAAAYQDATTTAGTTLPATVDVNGTATPVQWSWPGTMFENPYDTVEITGKVGVDTVKAQVEVLPKKDTNDLVYFIDANNDAGTESKAFNSVKALSTTVKNTVADQVYNTTDKWGRVGTNFRPKSTGNVDVTKKIQTGWYSADKTTALTYNFDLEPGTYTLTAGLNEWWTTGARSVKYVVSGTGMTTVTSEASTVSSIGSSSVKDATFTVDTACTVKMEVQNATTGEAPALSWFGVAKGKITRPAAQTRYADVVVNGTDVAAAAANVNGLTYKGYGLLSGNSTSNLLMDYKVEAPEKYNELLKVLFGGEHPLMDHVKMEMGNDGNTSTGSDSCTMRFENEQADASRSPGFQLAADAKKINPSVKVSFLRWCMPTWVESAWKSDRTGAGYAAMYKWYRETVFDAYEKYGYVVDYINPDTNETSDPDEAFIKWFKAKVEAETEFPAYMDAAAKTAYNNIKIIASDENTSLNIVPSMRADSALFNAVDAVGFHYRAGDTNSTADYRKLADVDDKEVWYSEGCAIFSYSEYQKNKTIAYGGGTIGGFQSPLALADNFIMSFVYSRKTHYIFQPAVGSFYEGAQYDHKEIISAREPWAGYIHYDSIIYMLQQFSKFAVTGWENDTNTAGIWRVIPNASGNTSSGWDHITNESGNPSYMTLAAPDKKNFSVVMVNNSNKKVVYTVKAQNMDIAAGAPMEVWETKTDSYLQYKGEAGYADGTYTVTVEPYSMVTLTTLDCNTKAEYTERLPESAEKTVLDTDATGATLDSTDEILYADDYNYDEYSGYKAYGADYLTSRGNEPRNTVDLSGAFAVKDGKLTQLLNSRVSEWNWNDPNCTVGDFRWMNYKASVDVTVNTGYAGLNIRQQTGMGFEGSGYNLRIDKDGVWTLKKRNAIVKPDATGTVAKSATGTYKLSLQGKGAEITAWIDGVQVYSYTDTTPEYFGRVRFGSAWSETSFDNLLVEKVDGYEPYATELLDNADDKVDYTGAWDIKVAGNGASSNDWYRSKSTTTTAGSSFKFDMNGAGFALLGGNDGTAILDVNVDGVAVATDATTQVSNQHYSTYMLTGLKDSAHTVTVTVKSGTLVLDAVDFLASSENNKTDLNAIIAQTEGIVQKDTMVVTAWQPFVDSLKAAKDVTANLRASKKEISDAATALKAAANAIVNTTDLAAQSAKAIDATLYTAGSYAKVTAALADAKTALEADLKNQITVDAALTALKSAEAGLVGISDLNAEIKTAEAIKATLYTADSYAKVAKALSAAKTAIANAEIPQNEVDSVLAALQTAESGLISISDLNAEIKTTEAISATFYTTDSYAKVTKAVADAKAVVANAAATKDSIDGAVAALKTAVTGLVEVPKTNTIQSTSTDSELPTVELGGTFAKTAKVVIEAITEGTQDYKDLATEVPANYKTVMAADISVSGAAEGPFTVTIQVGTEYNGKNAIVLHHPASGAMEKFNCVVENGAVTVTVNSFSPFAVTVEKDAVINNGSNITTPDSATPVNGGNATAGGNISTGDTTPVVGIIAIVMGSALLLAVLVIMSASKRKKAGNSDMK